MNLKKKKKKETKMEELLHSKDHGFKNQTGPAGPTGSTGNWPLIRSGYDKKPEIY